MQGYDGVRLRVQAIGFSVQGFGFIAIRAVDFGSAVSGAGSDTSIPSLMRHLRGPNHQKLRSPKGLSNYRYFFLVPDCNYNIEELSRSL